MAHTPQPVATRERIDHLLSYLETEWARVPAYIKQWKTWDEDERLDFVLEWDIRKDKLATLRAYARDGVLTPGDMKRYEAIEALVACNTPLLQPLLDED